jgi:Flp pilus assembly protein CpaB
MSVVAVIAFVLLGVLLGPRAGGGSTQIVVASRDIAFRTSIGKADVQLKSVVSADAPPNAATMDELLQGFVAEIDIKQGQPITRNMVAHQGDLIVGPSPALLPIPAGYVALAVPTSEQQGVAGYVQAGDYITVIATITASTLGATGPLASQPIVQPVFTNVHVIKIGPATSGSSAPGGQQAGVSSSLTLVMSLCDAKFFSWFLTQASVKYVLESYDAYPKEAVPPDPACKDINSDLGKSGVGPSEVDSRYHFTSHVPKS